MRKTMALSLDSYEGANLIIIKFCTKTVGKEELILQKEISNKIQLNC